MSSHGYKWFFVFLVFVLGLVQPNSFLDKAIVNSETIKIWPPIGTSATYLCSNWYPTATLATLAGEWGPVSREFKEIYKEIKEYAMKMTGVTEEPPPWEIESQWVDGLLDELNQTMSCIFTWKVIDSNATHYWIHVNITLTIVNVENPDKLENVEELVEVLENPAYIASRSLEETIIVDLERRMYVNGEYKGIWNFYLYPWEIVDGGLVDLSDGSFWDIDVLPPAILSRASAEKLLDVYESLGSHSGGLLVHYMDKLGIPRERVMLASRNVLLFSEELGEEERMKELEEWKRLPLEFDVEIANISLEEFARAHGSDRGTSSKFYSLAIRELFDVETGIMIWHNDFAYQPDLFTKVFKLFVRDKYVPLLVDFGPSFIYLSYYEIGSINEIEIAVEEHSETITEETISYNDTKENTSTKTMTPQEPVYNQTTTRSSNVRISTSSITYTSTRDQSTTPRMKPGYDNSSTDRTTSISPFKRLQQDEGVEDATKPASLTEPREIEGERSGIFTFNEMLIIVLGVLAIIIIIYVRGVRRWV